MATSSSKATILFIQPRGVDQEALATAVELRNLRDSLLRELHGDRLDWQELPAARIKDLAWGLRRYQPAIIHFAGHGSRYGELYLDASDDKSSQPLSVKNLAETLRVYQAEARQPVRLVVLAGCDTDRAAESAAPHVHCAIGMSDKVGDEAVAKHFTPSLYAALADGRSVQNAVDTAVAELRNQGYDEDADIVRVFSAPGVDVARLMLSDLMLPDQSLEQLHIKYLQRLFEQKKWATVSMNLFDPSFGRRVDLVDIYTTLPVDFALFLRTAKGQVQDWWCGRSDQNWDKLAEQEPFALESAGRAKRGRPGDEPGERLPKPRAWTEMNVGETALQPLVKLAQQWAQDQRSKSDDKKTLRWQVNAHHAALVQPRFVLIGDPGSGKSTFLRHLALCSAGTLLREAGADGAPVAASLDALHGWTRAYTPIYVELRTLVSSFQQLPADPAHGADLPGLPEFRRYVHDHLPTEGDETLIDLLFARLRQGQAAILLDGLDEVSQAADPRRRAQIQAFVAELVKEFDGAPIIVTARPYAYRQGEWALEGFGRVELAPLDTSRQAEMAQRLFGQLLSQDTSRQVEAFVAALDAIPDDLCSNPLLLTLLAALWVRKPAHERYLPSTRGELYRRALTLLLVDWVRIKVGEFSVEKDLKLTPDDLRLVLELVACHAQEQRSRPDEMAVITEGNIYTALRVIGQGRVADDLLAHLEQQAGMLLEAVEGGPGVLVATFEKQFRFLHLSFQEYLAACELLHRSDEPRPHGLPVLPARSFPEGLAHYVIKAPELWANVLRLAVDELFYQKRAADAWELLSLCCEPYCRDGESVQAAVLALHVALEAEMFKAVVDRRVRPYYQDLHDAATAALVDHQRLTPEQRDIAGQLLGSGPFPGHDPRPGVGVKNGLPDIDWVPISDDGSWTYQSKTHKALDTYWIARYPITYAQFEVFLRARDGFKEDGWWRGLDAPKNHRVKADEQWFKYWNHPRECVSWWDAMAFCAWLTARAHDHPGLLPKDARCTGNWQITLPTEQQWEKAARGRDGRQYPWEGNDYRSGYANIDETIRKVGPHYLQKTTAVGMYPQGVSPYGVADLSGNVWEWCLNEYESGKTNPGGDATRVMRGGSWYSHPLVAAAPFRDSNHPVTRIVDNGFRVVVVGCVHALPSLLWCGPWGPHGRLAPRASPVPAMLAAVHATPVNRGEGEEQRRTCLVCTQRLKSPLPHGSNDFSRFWRSRGAASVRRIQKPGARERPAPISSTPSSVSATRPAVDRSASPSC